MKTPFKDRVPTDLAENIKWRVAVHRRTMKDPKFRNALRACCAADPIFFLNGFGWTYDPRGLTPDKQRPFPKIPFILYPFQEEALAWLIDHIGRRDGLIEKSRDMGASCLCISAVSWYWLFRPLQSFLLVSRVEEYVEKSGNPKALFWKFDYLIDNLPQWLRPLGYNHNAHRMKMHAENPENGSVIDGESTNKRVARGDRRTAIILDEFAAVETGDQVLSSTRDATPCRIFNSTPEGIANAFYKMKCSNIDKLRLHWTTHPLKAAGLYSKVGGTYQILDEEYWSKIDNPFEQMAALDKLIVDKEVPLPDDKCRSPWYANECDRAGSAREIAQEVDIDYEGSGHQFFSAEKIQELILSGTRPPFVIGDLEIDETTCEPIRFREDSNGRLRLWCLLDADGNPTCKNKLSIGIDVSAGTGASNSCLAGIDIKLQEKVFEFASPYMRPEAFGKYAVAIARWFAGDAKNRKPFLIWESGGPGRQFGSVVIESGYSNVYYRKNDTSITKKVTDFPGWAAVPEAKDALLGSYRDAIESKRYQNWSKLAMEETLEYVFGATGHVMHAKSANKDDPSGAKSNHGDRVTADALAWKGVGERGAKPKRSREPDIPVGSLAWRRKMREEEKRPLNSELGPGW